MRAPAMFEVPPLLDFSAEVAPLNRLTHDALLLLDAHGDVRPLEEIEAEVIRFAIAHYRGQMSEVARRLQIGALYALSQVRESRARATRRPRNARNPPRRINASR
jgi:DNA-binding NtrC family response regulator